MSGPGAPLGRHDAGARPTAREVVGRVEAAGGGELAAVVAGPAGDGASEASEGPEGAARGA